MGVVEIVLCCAYMSEKVLSPVVDGLIHRHDNLDHVKLKTYEFLPNFFPLKLDTSAYSMEVSTCQEVDRLIRESLYQFRRGLLVRGAMTKLTVHTCN